VEAVSAEGGGSVTLDLTVGWGSGVHDDLTWANVSRPVIGRLVVVAESTLQIPVDPRDPDEGYLERHYYWRRAVPRSTAASDPAPEDTGGGPPVCDLILVYRSADTGERAHGIQYMVDEIWTNDHLAEYAKRLEAIRASQRTKHPQGRGPLATPWRWLAAAGRRVRRGS
jgi:hypothetical protein